MVRSRLLWLLPAGLLVTGSLGVNHGVTPGRSAAAGLLAAVAGGAMLLAWWRGRTAVVIAGASVGGYFAVGLANGPIFLALPLVVLVAAQRLRPRILLPAAAVAVALTAAGLVVRSAAHGRPWPETVWECTTTGALCAGAAVGGWWLSDRRRMRVERAERAASEEQLRMAQDLHDGVGHGLAVIAMQAGVALHVLERDPAAARAALEAIRDTSRESLEALRAELSRLSGGPAPRRATPGLADLDALLDRVRAGGLAVERRGGPDGTIDPGDGAGHAAYAVVQEALTNVLRHARATRATVTVERAGERLVVTVTDDGVGPAPAPPGQQGGQDGGMGIAGMRSRVEALGGTLVAGPDPDAPGFRVRASIPVGP